MQSPGPDRERRKAFLRQVAYVGAERAQRIDQIADGALMHPRHARELVLPASKRERGGQRPEGGARVTEKKLRPLDRKPAAVAANGKIARGATALDADAEPVAAR